ncbi:MAG: alpha-2-macroglobulin family protein, partial [Proteobacteria bacterium]
VVKKDGDLSFLPYRLQSQSLSFSNFDVGGLHESKENDQLTAFLFSDRGIYRPGDSVNVGMMVRARNAKNTFQDVPIVWAVTDARGTEIHREKIKASSGDLSSLNFKTAEAGSTGTYGIQVFIQKPNRSDELIGSLSVRVEEFLPDRMRIAATISEQTTEGWVKPKDLKGLVSLKNLFGTPAEARRVVGEVALTPTHPYFRAYKEFSFVALKGDEKSFTETLSNAETDSAGEASFDLDLERFGTSLYNLRFNAEGYEATGGRAVAASAQTLVSSKDFLVGLKGNESLSYLKKGSEHSVQVIAINPKLKMIPMKDVKAVIIERRYVSTLLQQDDGTYKYQSVVKEITGEPKPFAISEKGSTFKLPTGLPGDFALVFKDSADVELNRIAFSVIGEANLSRSLEKNAELQLTLDKADYQPGSEIEIQIKGPYTGAGLITIERDKVFASKWFKTST